MLINPFQNGERVHPAPQPNPVGNAPAGGLSGPGPLVPVDPLIPVGSPILPPRGISPVGPVAHPINVDSSNL